MNIIVLGAGVVGVASAYYLNRAGHQVTVIDRQSGAADETSFGNAGQLSFGYTTPWAAPNVPLKALKWLGKAHSPLIIKPDGTRFQMQWLIHMLWQCRLTAYNRNQSRMMRISEYSRSLLHEFEEEEGMYFEQRHQGTLHLFRDASAFKKHQKNGMSVLDAFHVPYRVLNAEQVLAYEPALAHLRQNMAGGIHLPNDSTGDCRLFTQKLTELCQQRGVKFIFNREIKDLQISGSLIKSVRTSDERFTADAFVCALGCFSRPMLEKIGLDLPIYPVKGYSLTIDITDESHAPQSTVLDETYKVALTRFDKRIRVGGMAELSGYALSRPPVHRETLEMVSNQLFPQSGDTQKAFYWSGLRPVTPDSTPIIGATSFDNLWINTGHGTLGWTMSLGSGKITADLISKGQADVFTGDLNLSRYQR